MKRDLRHILQYKLSGMLYVLWKFRRPVIVPFRNTYLRFNRNCHASGTGRLLLGLQWEEGRFSPSQMIMRAHSALIVNGNFRIYSGGSLWINQNATLTLGSGYVNNHLNLSCFESIEIGNDVAISENVTIRDCDDHFVGNNKASEPVKIGNHVWIGINATILKGVTIGDGAVIAACALVNRDVPARTLVAGVPATIKTNDVEWHV
jgi:acetyltransferase-like isoleucine patch superfamily enzyme